MLQIGTGHQQGRVILPGKYPCLAGDGLSRVRMITGNKQDLDPGCMTFINSRRNLFAKRILNADKTNKNQFFFLVHPGEMRSPLPPRHPVPDRLKQ